MNSFKLESARYALEPLEFKVDNEKLETPEIQADDVVDVSKNSVKWAVEKLKKPVLKNDSGLFVNSLNGFPGVYTRYVEETIGVDGLLKLMEGFDDRSAYFKEAIAYCEPGKEPIVFVGITKGTIDIKQSGTYGCSWDFVFIPDGEDRTLACIEDEKRWKYWSQEAYVELAKYLEKNSVK